MAQTITPGQMDLVLRFMMSMMGDYVMYTADAFFIIADYNMQHSIT